ncbi:MULTISPECIES: hypothetical protein [unclassified Streptomyces]|uniref:hypothetical protein n=1 Tax=unclassified Streptomyces TaxID=2593676 RepID=UPI0033336F29
MRLNQLPGDLGGGPDVAHSAADKQGAANTLNKDIEPDTSKAGRWVDDETGAVVKAFGVKDGHGWLTSGAVRKAHKTWGEQVQGLVRRLMGDEAALRRNDAVMTGTDIGTRVNMRRISVFDSYSSPTP